MSSVLRDQDIVVTENRIVSISRRGSRAHPDGAEVVDVSGHYIVPGFIDTHAHLGVHDPRCAPATQLGPGRQPGLRRDSGARRPDLYRKTTWPTGTWLRSECQWDSGFSWWAERRQINPISNPTRRLMLFSDATRSITGPPT